MRNIFLAASAVLAIVTSPAFAQETSITTGVVGAGIGAAVAGPPGAWVGGALGAAAGASVDANRYRYTGEIRTGVVLPTQGVVYQPLPEKAYLRTFRGERKYVYTVVDDAGPNDRYVVVDPATHTVVQVL